MTARVEFSPKIQGESVYYEFDFLGRLTSSEIIITQVVTCSVWSGVDPAPASMISGSAVAVNTSVVRQLIIAGIAGVVYYLLCTITTNLGQTLQLSAYLVVLPTPVP